MANNSGKPRKIHWEDESNPTGIYCQKGAIVDPKKSKDKDKVNCGNCRYKMNKPRMSKKRLTKKMWKPTELPEPTKTEVEAAEKRGDNLQKKTQRGWW